MLDKPEIAAFRKRLPDYLKAKGIDINKNFRCLRPDHEDIHPSMSYDKKRNKVHCYSCGFDGDIFDLVGQEHNLTAFVDQAKLIKKLIQELKDETDMSNEANNTPALPEANFYLAVDLPNCRQNVRQSKEAIQNAMLGAKNRLLRKAGHFPNARRKI